MIGNIKEIFLPKTGMQEKQLLQDPGGHSYSQMSWN